MYPIDSLCKLFGVTKQAYYKHNEDVILLKVAQEIFVLQYIHEIRKKDPGIGGMKLWYMYQKVFGNSNPVGRYSFENIVDRYGLKVRKRVRMPNTTDSTHGLPVYPNAIKDFVPEAPNRLWVSDITYIPVWFNESEYNFSYLSLILDAYTEEIIGWSVGSTLEAVYPIEALKMALKRIKGQENHQLIHHSDRGCQYASNEYVSILKEHKIRISMTESGNPKDNAQAERINSTMKNELLKGKIFRNVKEVKAAVNVAIDFYNNERPHMSVDMLTPAQATNCTGEIEKKWKSYRLIAIKSRLDGLNIAGNGLPSFACQGFPSGLHPSVNS